MTGRYIEPVNESKADPAYALEPTEASIASWLHENWRPDITLREWWARLARAGLGFPTWPENRGGRGWDRASLRILSQAFGQVGAIGGLCAGLVARPSLWHNCSHDH